MITCLISVIALSLFDHTSVISSRNLWSAASRRGVVKILHDGNGPGEFGMVSVQFGTYDKQGYHKSIVKTIGSGIIRKAKIGVHDYVGIGRNQLFISVEMGSVSTEILDFDGTNLRILYSGYPVRTHTRPYRTAKKHWQLEEITHTTRITKQDVSDGFRSMNKYTMVRSLRWNGERWAPVTRHGDYKD